MGVRACKANRDRRSTDSGVAGNGPRSAVLSFCSVESAVARPCTLLAAACRSASQLRHASTRTDMQCGGCHTQLPSIRPLPTSHIAIPHLCAGVPGTDAPHPGIRRRAVAAAAVPDEPRSGLDRPIALTDGPGPRAAAGGGAEREAESPPRQDPRLHRCPRRGQRRLQNAQMLPALRCVRCAALTKLGVCVCVCETALCRH